MDRTRDIVTILGLNVRDPSVRAIIDEHRLVLDDDHDPTLYWENPAEGLALRQQGDSRIGTIFLHGGGKDGFAPFRGPLPFGLSFSSKRSDVHSVLGRPTLSGGPTRLPNVAEDGGWDRYDRIDATFHFSYHTEEDRILLLTIMTPSRRADRLGDTHSVKVVTVPHTEPPMWKEIKVASAVLARAATRIGAPLNREDCSLAKQTAAELEEERRRALNELDELVRLGSAAHARGGFWRDLMRVCEALSLDDRLEEMRERFSRALRETKPAGSEDAG